MLWGGLMGCLLQGPGLHLGLGLLLVGLAGCGDENLPVDPRESVIVDVVVGLSAPVGQVVTVDLRTSADVTLELGTPSAEVWHDMLAHSQEYSRPVYLEIVSRTRRILDVALPLVSPVQALNETDASVEVALVYSAAIHYLYRTKPGFHEMLGLLQAALASGDTLVVTEKDGQGIVDVRVAVPR